MSVDPKFGRYCDGCGRDLPTAVRIHLGREYCRACYQTEFVAATCSACQQTMRKHRNAEAATAVCAACERATRRCIRCDKPTPRAGKLVGAGAACSACAPYFRDPKACTACGAPSTRLSRPLFMGLDNAVCEHCRRRLTHATCAGCSRYRAVACHDGDRPLCGHCLPQQPTTHPCPQCGTEVAGGGRGRCRPCINRKATARRALLLAASLESSWARELWQAFVDRQVEATPADPKLLARLEHAAQFFGLLDRTFETQQEINSQTLTARIDSRILRQHLVATRQVIGALGLEAVEEHREEVTEERRIGDLLARNGTSSHAALLAAFDAWLCAQGAATRTRRLYLRAAEAFCVGEGICDQAWSPAQATHFLKKFPGHAASLGRFFTYCREQLHWEVKMPPKAAWKPNERTKTASQVQRLRHTLQRTEAKNEEALSTRELARVLSLATGVPAAQLVRERGNGPTAAGADGTIMVTTDAVIAPADPLYRYARRWIELAKRKASKDLLE